jgi:hypothetical protein
MKVGPMAVKAAPLGLAWLLGACVSAYQPPTLAEPHAVVKLRRTYDTIAGTRLRESLLIDDHPAHAAEVPSGLASTPRIDSSLVHPTPATFGMASSFYHQEMRLIQETYYVQEPYSTYESYNCGSGSSYRTCSRSATHYRSVTRYRTVMRRVDVVDAACQASRRFAPAVGHVYLLQYSFQEHGACSLSCFEQVPNDDGTFRNLTCPVTPPAK